MGGIQSQRLENRLKVNEWNHYISLMRQPLGLGDMSSNGRLYLDPISDFASLPPTDIASLLSLCVDKPLSQLCVLVDVCLWRGENKIAQIIQFTFSFLI